MFKKTLALLGALIILFGLFGCHNTYYNDGSDFTSSDYNDEDNKKTAVAPTDISELSDFEKSFIKELFGEEFNFKGYDNMTDGEKRKIIEYFKTFNEGYYTVGFENGFFFTKNEFEGKEVYSVPWGSEKLSEKIEPPTFGTCTKTSVSQSTGFNADFSGVHKNEVLRYCDKLRALEFKEVEPQGENLPEELDDTRIRKSFKNSDGDTVSVIFAEGVLQINICEDIAE